MWRLGIFLWHILEGPVKLKLSHHEPKSSRERWFPCIGRVSLTPLTTVCFLRFYLPLFFFFFPQMWGSLYHTTLMDRSVRERKTCICFTSSSYSWMNTLQEVVFILPHSPYSPWFSTVSAKLIFVSTSPSCLVIQVSCWWDFPLSFFPPTAISYFLFYQESHNTL